MTRAQQAKAPDIMQTQLRLPRELWERIKAAGAVDKRSANFAAVTALEAAFPSRRGPRK